MWYRGNTSVFSSSGLDRTFAILAIVNWRAGIPGICVIWRKSGVTRKIRADSVLSRVSGRNTRYFGQILQCVFVSELYNTAGFVPELYNDEPTTGSRLHNWQHNATKFVKYRNLPRFIPPALHSPLYFTDVCAHPPYNHYIVRICCYLVSYYEIRRHCCPDYTAAQFCTLLYDRKPCKENSTSR